jgi:hypothetical protein
MAVPTVSEEYLDKRGLALESKRGSLAARSLLWSVIARRDRKANDRSTLGPCQSAVASRAVLYYPVPTSLDVVAG